MNIHPNYAAELTLPYLLDNREGMDYFGLDPVTMTALRKQSFYLDLPGQTIRYSHKYSRELRKRLISPDRQVGRVKEAEDFAQSVLAQEIMQEEGDYLSHQITKASKNGLVRASALKRLLFIGRSTMTNWEYDQGIEVVRQNGIVHLDELTLRDEVCVWHYPDVLYADPPLDQ